MANQISEQPSEQKKVDPEYRKWLVAAEQKSQDDYDKTVLSLSGGALGISFVFVKDIVGAAPVQHSAFLIWAWVLWAASSFAVLVSFFMSHLALREAIRQCDDGAIFAKKPGGSYSVITLLLNISGAVAFLAGVCFMAAFVYTNLSNRENPHDREKATHSSTTAPNPTKLSTEPPTKG